MCPGSAAPKRAVHRPVQHVPVRSQPAIYAAILSRAKARSSTMGSFDYNIMSGSLGVSGGWYGGFNTTAMSPIWSTNQLEKTFAVSARSQCPHFCSGCGTNIHRREGNCSFFLHGSFGSRLPMHLWQILENVRDNICAPELGI